MAESSGTSPIDAQSAPLDDVQMPYLAHEEADFGGYGGKYTIHHFYFQCKKVGQKPIQFPLDANPRHPERNAQVGAMRDTLQNDPEDFVNRNNGIVMLASEVDVDGGIASDEAEGTAHFRFGEGEGICNGGHTLLAIQDHGDHPRAVVHVEVIELNGIDSKSTSRRQEISKIADARNNNNQLQERSEANFLGYYDQYKSELLNDTIVNWHEGDPHAVDNAINAYQFFRLLKSLDVNEFGHPLYDERGKNHSQLATSVSRVHRRWKESMDEWKSGEGIDKNRPLRYLTPLTNDIIFIREMVSHHLKYFDYGPGMRKKTLFQKYIKSDLRDLFIKSFDHNDGYDLPNPVEVLFTGLFRTNLYVSESETGSSELVGWFRDLEKLWDQRSKAVLNSLHGNFKDNGDDPKDFIRASAPFSNDLYIHGMSDSVDESPDIVYQIGEEDKVRYERVENNDEASHELTVYEDPSKPDELAAVSGDISATPMKQVDLSEVYHYTTNNKL
ncbi:AIPR family protein [Halorubrum xinjiangense]|uniref:AIPR family protein n=1 Tax=Halorubrum xinjiangense TaxID=261291 RepID=UPI003C6F5E47